MRAQIQTELHKILAESVSICARFMRRRYENKSSAVWWGGGRVIRYNCCSGRWQITQEEY